MFDPKIKVDRALYDRVRKASEAAGYATVDEFVAHVLEKVVGNDAPGESEDEVRKRLQGLGYLQ